MSCETAGVLTASQFNPPYRNLASPPPYLPTDFTGRIIDRIIGTLLRTSLLLAALGSLLMLVRMILATLVPIVSYWWSSVTFVLATAVLAAAVYMHDRICAAKTRPSGA